LLSTPFLAFILLPVVLGVFAVARHPCCLLASLLLKASLLLLWSPLLLVLTPLSAFIWWTAVLGVSDVAGHPAVQASLLFLVILAVAVAGFLAV
jgi:hypothetical protein